SAPSRRIHRAMFATSSSWVMVSPPGCGQGPTGSVGAGAASLEFADGRRHGENAELLPSLFAFCQAGISIMRMERLTDLDERLLAALRNDGRAPIATLAARL